MVLRVGVALGAFCKRLQIPGSIVVAYRKLELSTRPLSGSLRELV